MMGVGKDRIDNDDREDLLTFEKVADILDKSFLKNRNPAVSMMNGRIHGFHEKTLVMKFRMDERFEDQLGTGLTRGMTNVMMDAVCANTVVLFTRLQQTVATLEQKCMFMKEAPVNTDLYCIGKLLHHEPTLAFLEAELREGSPDGPLLVVSSQVNALLTLPKKQKKNQNAKL